jgi:hypothetical protein
MSQGVSEDIRIDARVTSFKEENGWFRIEIDHPMITKPASTKQAERAEEAKQLYQSGAVGHIAITKKIGPKVNPNNNQPYVDFYWEHGEPIETPPDENEPAAHGFSAGERGYGWKTDPDDAWRMALTSGSERAVQTLPHMPETQRDFETQKRIAIAWAKFIYFTPPADFPTFGNSPAGMDAAEGEDIPF